MRYRNCHECNRYGLAVVKVEQSIKRLCLECLVRQGRGWTYRRYICSVVGCDSAPRHLVVVDDGDLRSLLVCSKHYKKIKHEALAVVPLPEWFADDDDIILDDEGITVQLELFSSLDDDPPDAKRRDDTSKRSGSVEHAPIHDGPVALVIDTR